MKRKKFIGRPISKKVTNCKICESKILENVRVKDIAQKQDQKQAAWSLKCLCLLVV